MKLTPDERATIVAELLASLEPDLPTQARSEREWIEDIERGPVAGRNLFWTSVVRLQFAM